MLTVAIQKSGRLSEATLKLLNDCGISFRNGNTPKLKSSATNFPLQILFLRDDDIPECVADGITDAGIVGENVCAEKEKPVEIIERLGFAQCRLSIAVPREFDYQSQEDLNGLNIATSYPNLLGQFLKTQNIRASIREISGSVEVAPGIGWADAIFDIVSTGSTLISNGLKEVETVMESQAVIIAGKPLSPEKEAIREKLLFRIRAVNRAKNYKYILLNSPNDALERIAEILPGIKSPTVMPLALEGWSSVHTVIREDDFWELIEDLKDAGAQGILATPIGKMVV